MKDIFLKLSKGINTFECEWEGEKNECSILILDIKGNRAFVKFKNKVKKTERKEVEKSFSWGEDESTEMIDVEVETDEEWITIK